MSDESRTRSAQRPGRAPGPAAGDVPTAGALIAIGLFAAVIVAFLPALNADFLAWDDAGTIINNQNFRGFQPWRLKWMFTTGYMGHYQPLAWMTLALDHALWGMQPRGYHLTSVLLHAINTLLVGLLADRLIRIARGSAAVPAPRTNGTAAAAIFAALLFGIHPLRVEAVVWVTERRDVLSTLFALLCVVAHVEHASAQATAVPQRSRRWYFASLALFLLALLSKAIIVVLPAVLLALDWYPLRRVSDDPRRWPAPAQRGVWLEKIPHALLAVVFAGLILNIQQTYIVSMAQHGVAARLAQAAYALVYYPRVTALPVDLLPLYEIVLPLDWQQPRFFISAAVVVAALVAVAALARRAPGLLVAVIAYLVFVLPLSGLLQNGPQLMADRYSYVSMIGGMIVLAAAWERWGFAHDGMRRAVALALALAAVMVLAICTWNYSTAWQTSAQLWSYTLARQEAHATAHSSLGTALMDEGQRSQALQHYRRALELRPDLFEPAYNLARAMFMQGDAAAAEPIVRSALTHHPDQPQLHWLLADCLLWRDAWPEAAEHYRIVLRSTPDAAAVHANLGLALSEMGEFDEAIEHLQVAATRQPERPQTHVTLARLIWAHRRDAAQAKRHLQDGLRHDPRHPAALALLAAIDAAATSRPAR